MTSRPRIDSGTTDRLLDGTIRPQDAPPGTETIAGLIAEAREVPAGTTSGPLLAAMTAAIQGSPVPAQTPQRTSSVLARILRPKTAISAIAAVLFSASAAAAGSGTLPETAQDGVAHVVRHVGIDLPDSDDEARDAAERDADRAAKDKLKAERKAAHDAEKAQKASDDADDADEPKAVEDDGNPNNDHGKAVSDVARNDDAEGRQHGENVSTAAHDGKNDDADDRAGADADDKADDAGDKADDDSDDAGESDDAGDDHGGNSGRGGGH